MCQQGSCLHGQPAPHFNGQCCPVRLDRKTIRKYLRQPVVDAEERALAYTETNRPEIAEAYIVAAVRELERDGHGRRVQQVILDQYGLAA